MADSRGLRVAKYALRPATWRHAGRRARWSASRPSSPSKVPLSWPIDEYAREQMIVEWPQRYSWSNAAAFAEPIKHGIAEHVQVRSTDLAQTEGNLVLFRVRNGSDVLRVAFDYDDQLKLHELSGEVDLYFKTQYARGGYGTARIRPGGYVTKQRALYRYAHRWRELRAASAPSHDVAGRFGLSWAQEIRRNAIDLLRDQRRFSFEGGGTTVWWGEYMDEICRARLCLDLPGNGEFCYRLVEYLAIGACVVGPELHAELHVPLQGGVHLVRVPRSLDGLVERCEQLLNDEAARANIQREAEQYFDRYLALRQLGAYYIDSCWRALTSSGGTPGVSNPMPDRPVASDPANRPPNTFQD